MSIAVVACGDWTGEGACAVPHAALRATKSFVASWRRRRRPGSARRSFCMRVGTWADDIFETMSQDRLEASLDIDRLPAVDVVRIIQEEDARVAAAVAAERDKIAHAVDEIAERLGHGGRGLFPRAGGGGGRRPADAARVPPPLRAHSAALRGGPAGGGRGGAGAR